MKYAVYVEGQSEMLFVAYVLQEYSNYDPAKCGFLCINLTADDYERISFPKQGDMNSGDYYQIVNVNNDNLVVSKLKKDIPGLIAQGFNVIIGLKDVFGDLYGQLMKQKPEINREKIIVRCVPVSDWLLKYSYLCPLKSTHKKWSSSSTNPTAC